MKNVVDQIRSQFILFQVILKRQRHKLYRQRHFRESHRDRAKEREDETGRDGGGGEGEVLYLGTVQGVTGSRNKMLGISSSFSSPSYSLLYY